MIYDWMLNISLEIQLLWFSPWSYTKAMFLTVRYVPFAALGFNVQTQLAMGVSADTCRWVYPVVTWLIMPSIALAEVILMVRTWAVWHRDRKVGAALLVALVGTLFTACYCNVKFLKAFKLADPPFPTYRGCFVVGASDIMKTAFIFLTVLESLVLILMIISAVKSYREGSKNQLLAVIHRDGIVFYIYLLMATVANVCIMSLAPKDLVFMLTPVCCALYSIFTSRIVLNIRHIAQSGNSMNPPTELHGYHQETAPASALPLSYRKNSNHHTLDTSIWSQGRDDFN